MSSIFQVIEPDFIKVLKCSTLFRFFTKQAVPEGYIMTWQQDGTPSHNFTFIHNIWMRCILADILEIWVIYWLARSSDVTVLEFFVRRYSKSIVYQ